MRKAHGSDNIWRNGGPGYEGEARVALLTDAERAALGDDRAAIGRVEVLHGGTWEARMILADHQMPGPDYLSRARAHRED